MSSLDKLKKHPFLLLHTDIAEICRPFFQNFNFNIVNFIRRYDDGRVIYLCDNKAWLQNYLVNGYPSIGAFEQNPALAKQEYVLWSALSDSDPVVIYSREIFNIRYGITLIYKFPGGHDFFNLGTDQEERAVMGKMGNQLEELQRFSKNFYEKSHRLIINNQKHSLNLAEFNCDSTKASEEKKRLYLGPAYDYAHLTIKELTCLQQLIIGKTIPEIAITLETSARTIEKHIQNIKEKLHCKTQCELGFLAAKLGLDDK